jgi:heme-degrading monooxygenase HmoA
MFARKVAVRLKPASLEEFVRLMEGEVVPWLRQQPGFLDLITLAAQDGCEVATISFWDDERNAHAYDANGYPEALKILGELLDGTPYVKTFDVVSSTQQKVTYVHSAERKHPEPGSALEDTGPIQPVYGSYETNV